MENIIPDHSITPIIKVVILFWRARISSNPQSRQYWCQSECNWEDTNNWVFQEETQGIGFLGDGTKAKKPKGRVRESRD